MVPMHQIRDLRCWAGSEQAEDYSRTIRGLFQPHTLEVRAPDCVHLGRSGSGGVEGGLTRVCSRAAASSVRTEHVVSRLAEPKCTLEFVTLKGVEGSTCETEHTRRDTQTRDAKRTTRNDTRRHRARTQSTNAGHREPGTTSAPTQRRTLKPRGRGPPTRNTRTHVPHDDSTRG